MVSDRLQRAMWRSSPARHEAGSPNVVGAVALGVACRELQRIGFDAIGKHESRLLGELDHRTRNIPGFRRLSLWGDDHERTATVAFTLESLDYRLVASALAAEFGIGVRHGCFCAHPLMLHLLGLDGSCATSLQAELRDGGSPELPGAVRTSFGIASTLDDVSYFMDALEKLAARGPSWTYSKMGNDYVPTPDTREVRLPWASA